MAGSLAARLRAAGSLTGGGLRLLGAGLARDSRHFRAMSSSGMPSSAAEAAGNGAADSSSSGEAGTCSSNPRASFSARTLHSANDELRAFRGEDKLKVASRELRSSCICGADGNSPRIIYLQEARDSERLDRIVNRLDTILDAKTAEQIYVERSLDKQKEYFDRRLSITKEELDKKISECKYEVKDVDATTRLLSQKYNSFKEDHELRMKEVQLSVIKTIGSAIAAIGGTGLAYFKVKEYWKDFKDKCCL